MPNIMESSSSASTTSSRLKTSSVSTVYLPSSPINNRNNNHNHNNSITNNNNNEHYSLRVEQNNNFNKPPQFKSAVTRSTSITSSPSSPSSTKTDTISLVDQHSPKLFFKYYSEPNTATNNNNNNNNNKLTNSNSFRYSNNNNINYSDNNNRSVGNGDHINPYIVKIQIPEKNRFKTNKSPSPVSPLLLSPIGSPLLSPTSKFNQQQQQQGKGKFIPRVSITSLKSTSSSIEENYPNNTNTNNNSLIKIIENTQQPQPKEQIIVEEMVQKSTINNTNSNNTSSSKNNNDLDVNKAQYLYYTKLTSGQCSPNSDTLDSGTCSDLENTPPPVPKKMSPKFNPQQLSQQQPILNVNGKDIQSSPSHIHNKRNNNNNTNAINLLENNKINNIKKNNEHFTDSEESESSLSCDSLNVTDLINNNNNNNNNFIINNNLKKIPQQMHLHQSISKTVINQHQQKSSPVFTTTSAVSSSINDTKSVINSTTTTSSSISSSSTLSSPVSSSPLNYLPDSLLRDIRDHSNKFHSNGINCDDNINEDGDDDNDNNNNNNNYGNGNSIIVDDDPQLLILKDNIKKIVNSENQNSVKLNNNINNINNINNNNNTIKSDSNNDNYENDKYYTFHINERLSEVQDNIGNEINVKNNLNQLNNGERKHDPDEETFAGYKDIHSGQSTIRSSKGTIRGVKNRVRNGIVTFLQMQQTNVKNYKEKDAGKVVLYSTSMGIVRDTYAKCANVKQILRTLLIKFEERDVFMSNEYQQEIKERMNSEDLNVPQLYVDGQYIGDAEQVERLNESGELRKMLKPYKCLNASKTCETCGGYRLLPCTSCNGSKKSVHRNHFTAEFVALKCMNCDEVGLVKCNNC